MLYLSQVSVSQTNTSLGVKKQNSSWLNMLTISDLNKKQYKAVTLFSPGNKQK